MVDTAPAAKRARRDKFAFDSNSDDDDDSVIKNMEMDTDSAHSDIFTSDDSESGWFVESPKHDGKLNRKKFVLKVPRGKASVPESVKNPGSALITDKRKNAISPEQFKVR